MSLFINPIQFQNDEKGRSTPLASLDFYETGTYDRKNTYSDIELTSPNPNPVIADRAGRFPKIYLDEGTPYRVVFSEFSKPNTYTEVWTEDDVTAGLSIANGILSVSSVADLFGLTGVAGQQISVGEYNVGTGIGGGPMVYDATLARSNHDGIIYHSPARDLATEGLAAYLTPSANADLGCWVRRDIEYITPQMAGMSPDIIDNSPSWQALLNSKPSQAHFSVPGVYKFLSSSSHDTSISITSVPGVTIDCTDGAFSGNNWTKFSGGFHQIENLGANAVKGERTVTFASAPSLSPGDVFVIFNPTNSSWSQFRTNYFAGEFCQVVSISGVEVVVSGELYDDYNTSDVDVYRLDSIVVNIGGLTVSGDKSLSLIDLEFCRDSLLLDIKSRHKNDSCITFKRSYNCVALESSIFNEGDGGDDYGIAVTNSQTIRVTGGSIYSRRHAITTGGDAEIGAVPCRDLRFSDLTLSNDINSGTHCADFHGNTEYSQYVNCEIYGGATWQGKNNGYVNCRIGSLLVGTCMLSGEILGGEHYATNCRFHTVTDPQLTSRGIIDVGGNSSPVDSRTQEDVTFKVNGGTIFGRNLSATTALVKINNNGSVNKINVDVSDIELDINNVNAVLFLRNLSGVADSSFIIVDKLKKKTAPSSITLVNHSGGAYLNFPHRLQSQTGLETLTTNTGVSVITGTPVTLKWVYPRKPHFTVGRGNRGYFTNRIGVAYLSTLTTTTATPAIATDDGTNFGSALTVDVSWNVGMNEL